VGSRQCPEGWRYLWTLPPGPCLLPGAGQPLAVMGTHWAHMGTGSMLTPLDYPWYLQSREKRPGVWSHEERPVACRCSPSTPMSGLCSNEAVKSQTRLA
jgi:hypothetical protein